MKKGKKHMDGTKRCRIELGLAAGESERQIAKEIGVSLSTVSREIKKHTAVSFKGCYGRTNQCVHRDDCMLIGVCSDCPAKGVSFDGLTQAQAHLLGRKPDLRNGLGSFLSRRPTSIRAATGRTG